MVFLPLSSIYQGLSTGEMGEGVYFTRRKAVFLCVPILKVSTSQSRLASFWQLFQILIPHNGYILSPGYGLNFLQTEGL
jgi:hypothetical protein